MEMAGKEVLKNTLAGFLFWDGLDILPKNRWENKTLKANDSVFMKPLFSKNRKNRLKNDWIYI